jgi:hypothetical protein
VAEALLARWARDFTIVCPAFPENGRTVFKGHLFVGDVLLSDSPHARPPADADDRRQPGARDAGADAAAASAWWTTDVVARGEAIARALHGAARRRRGRWPSWMRWTTTTCAMAPPEGHSRWWWPARGVPSACHPGADGLAPTPARRSCRRRAASRAVVSGSCSAATNAQVRPSARRAAGLRDRPAGAGRRALTWRRRSPGRGRLRAPGAGLCHRRARGREGRAGPAGRGANAGALVEPRAGRIAAGLVQPACASWWWPAARPPAPWCRRWACTQPAHRPADRPRRALDAWRHAAPGQLHLALKSGNFGSTDFFTKAFEVQA